MKKLIALLLVLGGLGLLGPATTNAAKAPTDSGDFTRARQVPSLRVPSGGSGGSILKTSCRSDSGDVCICGTGQICTAGPTGCSCGRPPV